MDVQPAREDAVIIEFANPYVESSFMDMDDNYEAAMSAHPVLDENSTHGFGEAEVEAQTVHSTQTEGGDSDSGLEVRSETPGMYSDNDVLVDGPSFLLPEQLWNILWAEHRREVGLDMN